MLEKQLFKNRQAKIKGQAIGLFLIVAVGAFAVVYIVGGFWSGATDDAEGIFNPRWILPGQVPEEEDPYAPVDLNLYKWTSVNIRFSIFHTLNEDASAAAGITVYIKDKNGVVETRQTDSSGQITSQGNRYDCFDWVDVFVGTVNNNTGYGQQKYRFQIPGYGDGSQDKPNPLDTGNNLLFNYYATASQVTAKILNGATDITSSYYNITTSGATANLRITWTLSTAERWIGEGYDYLEDGGEVEEFWLFILIKASSNTAPGTVEVGLAGSQTAMFGTSTLIVGKRMNPIYYDLDPEGVPYTGKGPSHSVDVTFGMANTGYSSNRTEFTMDIYLCVGTPWDYIIQTQQYESYSGGEIFIDSDITTWNWYS